MDKEFVHLEYRHFGLTLLVRSEQELSENTLGPNDDRFGLFFLQVELSFLIDKAVWLDRVKFSLEGSYDALELALDCCTILIGQDEYSFVLIKPISDDSLGVRQNQREVINEYLCPRRPDD